MSQLDPEQHNPLLDIRNLTKDFGGVTAVDHCSFQVREGTITGLIGPNGAGKTTLFNLISGFIKPTGGSIWYRGSRIDGLPPHRVFHKGVLRTFQIPRELKRVTVLENLMLVPTGQTGESLWSAWFQPGKVAREEKTLQQQALDVLDFLSLSPLANELADNLSTGQKKLLELARTLMANPRLVLLDEPGAGVNPSLMNVLVEDIRRSSQERGITFLLIEHDMDLVMNLCDPIIVMHNGKNLAEGSPEQIRSNPAVMEAYLGG